MKKGYIKLWRKILDNKYHPINTRYSRAWTEYEAFLDLIMLAHGSEQPKKIKKGSETILIQRGQIDLTVRQLASRWQWSSGKISRFLRDLLDDGSVSRSVNRWFTLITIENYDFFNPLNERKMNGSGTEVERKLNTYKERNKRNESNIYPLPPKRGVVEKKLLKWFSEMEDVDDPERLVKFFLKKYPEKVIADSLANSTCTSRTKFTKLCEFYFKKISKN